MPELLDPDSDVEVGMLDSDSDSDAEVEMEERPVRGQKEVYQPSKQEWDDHMRTHGVFRKWCPFCVRGKCTSGAHKSLKKSDEEREKETPVISLDYMGPKSGDSKSLKIKSLPIIAGIDRKRKWVFAHMVPRKGHDAHAITIVGREIDISGYASLIRKSDPEPAIRELIAAVRRERPGGVQTQVEESLVGEHESNGDAERAIQGIQGMMRTTSLALQSR